MSLFDSNRSVAISADMGASSYVVVDIETCDAPEVAVLAALESWTPPGNLKDPDKIDARKEEAAAKIRDKAGLLDASPIICIVAKTPTDSMIFSSMDLVKYEVPGWTVISSGDESAMLLAFRLWLDQAGGADTVIVGHNSRAFDVPKIRSAFIRNRYRLPFVLHPGGCQQYDTMSTLKLYSYEAQKKLYSPLTAVAMALDLPSPKGVISGKDVPRLYRDAQYETIINYAAGDVVTTERAYLLMSGQSTELR